MIPAEVLAKLAVLGLASDHAAAVASMLVDVEKATKAEASAAIEARRANDRDRKARQKHVSSREGTGTDVSAGKAAQRAHMRAEPETTLSEETQKQESKKASKSTTPAASRGTRLPADFVPDIAAAVSEGLPLVEAEREAEKFRDWWLAAPGSKGLKANWPATWRTWFRKRIEERSAKTGPPRKGPSFRDIARATDAILKETAPDARTPPYLRLAQ